MFVSIVIVHCYAWETDSETLSGSPNLWIPSSSHTVVPRLLIRLKGDAMLFKCFSENEYQKNKTFTFSVNVIVGITRESCCTFCVQVEKIKICFAVSVLSSFISGCISQIQKSQIKKDVRESQNPFKGYSSFSGCLCTAITQ